MTRKQKELRVKFEHLTEGQLHTKLEHLNKVIPDLQEEQYVVRQMLKQRRAVQLQAKRDEA